MRQRCWFKKLGLARQACGVPTRSCDYPMSQGSPSDIEKGRALERQLSAGGKLSRFFYDTKVGKGWLHVAYVVPIILCAKKITLGPLFLYNFAIDKNHGCFERDKWTSIMAYVYIPLSIVINVISWCSLVMNVGLLKKRFEAIIWFILLLIDLSICIAALYDMFAHVEFVTWPYPGGSNFYSVIIYLPQYFGTFFLTYIIFIRATRSSATLAKATWTKAAFNLLLYVLGGHVFGGLWYAFAIQKDVDCWTKACKKIHTSSNCNWQQFSCRYHVGNDIVVNRTTLNEMCHNKTQGTTIYDFGIYHEALESGIVEVSNILPKRILYGLRWGLQNLSGFGQSLQVSTDVWENIFVISFTFYSVVLFVFFIGNVQIYLQLKTKRSEEIRRKKEEIEKSMSFAKLPGNLKKHIKRYQPDKWEETKDVHFENLFNNVPNDIKKNIKRELCLQILKTVEEFRSWSDELLDELCDCTKPVSYTQYAQIIRKGKSIDEMLFIVHGKLQTYSWTNLNTSPTITNVSTSTTGSTSSTRYESTAPWGMSIDHLEDGMYCGGELVDWFREDPYSSNLPISTITIQTLTKVDAFALMSYNLQNVFIKHRAASASTQEQAPAESYPQTPLQSQLEPTSGDLT